MLVDGAISSIPETYVSEWSGNKDDDLASVSCPDDYTLVGCSCHSWWQHCEGAWTEGNTCYA